MVRLRSDHDHSTVVVKIKAPSISNASVCLALEFFGADWRHNMLVLTLHKGQDLILAMPGMAPVQVKVLQHSQSRVSLGIEAPRTVGVSRGGVRAPATHVDRG